ncbi:hypothetical protein HAZT_HAZT001961 [Hyalella azteca]|uniref:Elongation of very long chain fatty acids protein n=1 Tax=Hyalella azteca TaxID=294128 RepID=A0A6A0HFJ5_HYAAZ|nr:hypothetical protein HAZT_HAZT001961 [Hyalella azteca]
MFGNGCLQCLLGLTPAAFYLGHSMGIMANFCFGIRTAPLRYRFLRRDGGQGEGDGTPTPLHLSSRVRRCGRSCTVASSGAAIHVRLVSYNLAFIAAFLDNRVGGFWNWMFTLSKVPELGDTVFIVLRKQPLIFLHWYHHVTVLLYAWYSYSDYIATARWFVCMNYLVHSVMYSYYALKALKFKVSRYVAMFITTAQLAQMIMGAAVNIWAYQVKQAGNECHVSYENIKISLIMYTSYFVLFAHFFRRAYMKKPVTTDQKPITNGVSNGAYHYDKSKKGKFE